MNNSSPNEIKFPSIIFNYPASSYYKLPYISQSKLKNYIHSSEANADSSIISDTEAMRFGRCFHAMFLTGLIGKQQGIPIHNFDKRTKIGKEMYAEFLEKNITDYFNSADQANTALKMINNFHKSLPLHKNQLELVTRFRKHGEIEVTIFWQDSEGRKYKSRLDGLILDRDTRTAHIIDVKTTSKDLNPSRAYYEFRSMGYDMQMFVYYMALKSIGYEKINYHIFLMNTNGDYGIFNYLAGDQAFNDGAEKFQLAINKLDLINKKIENKQPLSSSITNDIDDLIHPALERGDF